MNPITVEAKLVGRRGPALAPLTLELDRPVRTARELLAAIVQQQIAAFAERKAEAQWLRVLTDRDIEDGLAAGRVVSAEQQRDPRRPDLAKSTETAITAFQDGLYFFFLNGVQVEDLDAPLPEVKSVLFVRLTPLAGG